MKILTTARPRKAIPLPWIAEAHSRYIKVRKRGTPEQRRAAWNEYVRRREAWVYHLKKHRLYGEHEREQQKAVGTFDFPERTRTR